MIENRARYALRAIIESRSHAGPVGLAGFAIPPQPTNVRKTASRSIGRADKKAVMPGLVPGIHVGELA
jgi:hypothetical protein